LFALRRRDALALDDPHKAEQRDGNDDSERSDAVEAIDLQHIFLDIGEIERETESTKRKDEERSTAPGERQAPQQQVAGNADGCNRNMQHFRKRTMVHNAAVPLGVDVARLGVCRVVDLESQRGNHDAGNGKEGDEVAHHPDASRRSFEEGAACLSCDGYDRQMEQLLGNGGRVAFFGGSFDPPHQGHLAVARAAKAALCLDEVLFAPVGAQPLKPNGSTAGFADRLEMTRLAIGDEPGFGLSGIDAPKPNGAPNYTIDALLLLRDQLRDGATLFCLMGADSFFGLRHWHRGAEIPFVSPLIVAARPGQPLDDVKAALPEGTRLEVSALSKRADAAEHGACGKLRTFLIRNVRGQASPFFLLPELHVDISASAIREAVRDKQGVAARPLREEAEETALVSPAVMRYIRAHKLYE